MGPDAPIPAVSVRRALRHLRKADPVMAEIIRRVGPYRIRYTEPDFETLARCITLQQLSGKAAKAIFARLTAEAARDGRLRPAELLALTPERLRALGFSRQKIAYLAALAEGITSGAVELGPLPGLPDEEVIRRLTVVKGIGVWTAQMYLLFALRRPDVLACGDLGIRVAVQKAYRMRALPTPARLEQKGKSWRPYASVACWYLWRSLEDQAGL